MTRRTNSPWTDQEQVFLASFINDDGDTDFTHRKITSMFHDVHPNAHPDSSIDKRLKEMKAHVRERGKAEVARHLSGEATRLVTDVSRPGARVEPEAPWDPVSIEERWARAERNTDEQIDYQQHRHNAHIYLDDDLPVGLAFISDQHIVADGTTFMRRLKQDAQLVEATPGMYGILGGDGVNNHVKHRSAMIASSSKPGMEWSLYDHYLELMKESLLALISGNHDDFSKDETDIDMVGRLAAKHRFFYAPDYVTLKVHLGTQEYVVHIRHQYRYNSGDNETHSVKKMWAMGEVDFDIGVLCHKHQVAMEPFEKHGVWRWAFRPGSYQYSSTYARRYGYGTSYPACPTAIILPHTREIIGFKDVRHAAFVLTSMRENWDEAKEAFI